MCAIASRTALVHGTCPNVCAQMESPRRQRSQSARASQNPLPLTGALTAPPPRALPAAERPRRSYPAEPRHRACPNVVATPVAIPGRAAVRPRLVPACPNASRTALAHGTCPNVCAGQRMPAQKARLFENSVSMISTGISKITAQYARSPQPATTSALQPRPGHHRHRTCPNVDALDRVSRLNDLQ